MQAALTARTLGQSLCVFRSPRQAPRDTINGFAHATCLQVQELRASAAASSATGDHTARLLGQLREAEALRSRLEGQILELTQQMSGAAEQRRAAAHEMAGLQAGLIRAGEERAQAEAQLAAMEKVRTGWRGGERAYVHMLLGWSGQDGWAQGAPGNACEPTPSTLHHANALQPAVHLSALPVATRRASALCQLRLV